MFDLESSSLSSLIRAFMARFIGDGRFYAVDVLLTGALFGTLNFNDFLLEAFVSFLLETLFGSFADLFGPVDDFISFALCYDYFLF
jgi:hypothetical protein